MTSYIFPDPDDYSSVSDLVKKGLIPKNLGPVAGKHFKKHYVEVNGAEPIKRLVGLDVNNNVVDNDSPLAVTRNVKEAIYPNSLFNKFLPYVLNQLNLPLPIIIHHD